MKKILVYSLLLLGILILAVVPYWTGVEAEKQFSSFSTLFAPLGKLTLVDENYQRGWLKSQAHTTFETQNAIDSEKSYFTFEHEIQHGFLPIKPAEIHSELKLAPQWQAQVNKILDYQALLKIHTTLDSNEGKSLIVMPPAKFKHQQSYALEWQGLTGEVNFQQNLLQQKLTGLNMDINMPDLQLTTSHARIGIHQTNFQVNIPYQSSGTLIGKIKLNFERLLLHMHTLPIQLNQLQFILQNRIENDKLTLIFDNQLQQLQIGQDHLGPHQLVIELRNLHMPILNTIQTALVESITQGISYDELQFFVAGIFMQYGLQLMQYQPEIAITNLLINTPDGEIKATLQAKLLKVDSRVLLNPILLINHIAAQLELKMPKETLILMLNKVGGEDIVEDWLAHQVLVPSTQIPNHVYTQMTLEEGVLKANGNIVSITSLLN